MGGRTHDFDKVFRALADETRREVLAVVARNELPVGEVAQRMRWIVGRSTVSRHLAILRDAGLVQEEPGSDGSRHYRMQLGSSHELEQAFAAVLALWKR
ncbi:MAG: winged helix-turn-helix transcriptional regulator [Myxococcales bacterium]|nr:winged helix-turn-helix transcriptional regulator [Myxococcales bacterium]